MKVVFLHPDFGIGGAERLVLDSVLALKKKGHKVCVVTNQFSSDHCFEELKDFREGFEKNFVIFSVFLKIWRLSHRNCLVQFLESFLRCVLISDFVLLHFMFAFTIVILTLFFVIRFIILEIFRFLIIRFSL